MGRTSAVKKEYTARRQDELNEMDETIIQSLTSEWGKNDKKCSFRNWQKKTQYNTQYNQEKMIQVNPVKAGELKVKRKKMKTLKDRSVSNLIDAVSL